VKTIDYWRNEWWDKHLSVAELIQLVQQDAYLAGLKKAGEIVSAVGQCSSTRAILAAMDRVKKL
jgi:hypothetical protein